MITHFDVMFVRNRPVLATDAETNIQKKIVADALVATFQEAYALALEGRYHLEVAA